MLYQNNKKNIRKQINDQNKLNNANNYRINVNVIRNIFDYTNKKSTKNTNKYNKKLQKIQLQSGKGYAKSFKKKLLEQKKIRSVNKINDTYNNNENQDFLDKNDTPKFKCFDLNQASKQTQSSINVGNRFVRRKNKVNLNRETVFYNGDYKKFAQDNDIKERLKNLRGKHWNKDNFQKVIHKALEEKAIRKALEVIKEVDEEKKDNKFCQKNTKTAMAKLRNRIKVIDVACDNLQDINNLTSGNNLNNDRLETEYCYQ